MSKKGPFDAAILHCIWGIVEQTPEEKKRYDELRKKLSSEMQDDIDRDIRIVIHFLEAAGKCDKPTWQKWLDWYGKKHLVLPYGFSDIIQALPDREGEKR